MKDSKQTEELLTERLRAFLAERGFNNTRERYEILEIALMLDSDEMPFSPAQVYELYQAKGGLGARATVYKTMHLLESATIITKVPMLVGSAVGYYFCHHFKDKVAVLCSECGKLTLHKRARFLQRLQAAPPQGYEVSLSMLFMIAVCRGCKRKITRMKNSARVVPPEAKINQNLCN